MALVLKNQPFFNESNAFKAVTAPVLYKDKKEFQEYFSNIVISIKDNIEFIKGQSKETIQGFLFNIFLLLSLSVKHPGFKEEKEWRIIYTGMEESLYLKNEITCLNGLPQKIFKIPLIDIPKENLTGIEIPQLLERIIIGPSDNASETIQAFESLLRDAGVEDPKTKIFYSDIPLRN